MKDTNNILTFNQWSGSDYNNDLTDIYRTSTDHKISCTKEYSNLGEQSFKIISLIDGQKNFIIDRQRFDGGTVLTGTVHLRVVKGTAYIRFHELTSNDHTDVTVQEGTEAIISLSHTVSATQQVQFLVYTYKEGCVMFLDNITLTSS